MDLNKIYMTIMNNEVELDEPCYCCDRYGRKLKIENIKDKTFFTEEEVCEQCKGTRYILTLEGKAIIKLIRRHIYMEGI